MVHNAQAIPAQGENIWRFSPFKTGISRQKSMTFRFIKQDDEIIMTESQGELFDLFGLKQENVLQKRIEDIFPAEMAVFKREVCERALNGESLTYESKLNDIPFLAAIGPIYKDSVVTEVYGFCVDLSERVQVETQLAESEQRFRSLMDHNIDALFSLDLDGKFTTVNKACSELTGYGETELLNMTFDPLMMPERKSIAIEQFNDALKGNAKMHETHIKQKNGEIRQITFTLTPIIVLNKIIGVFGIAKDVTARREAEKELRETKDLLESVIYHSSDAISVVHLTNYSVKVNPAFEQIYGWSQNELNNDATSHMLPIVPEDKAAESDRLMTIVKHGGYVKGVETIRLTKSGKRINVSLSLSPIYGENGDVVALSAISRDITDKKQKEKALKESEEKYRIIAENTTDLIGVVDLEGNVKYFSPSNRQLLGFDPSLYDGKKIQGFFHSDDRPKVKFAINEMIQTQKPVKFEVRCKHAHGHWVTLEANATPIINDFGQAESCVVVARDLTERKQTEEMLRKSDKLSVLGQLAAGVAHEIRNPLTSIRGFLQLLQSKASEDKDYYEIMLSEIDRINSIVGEFMLLAKPQAMNFIKTDLRDLLRHVISILDTQAILTNVQIYFESEPDLPEIWCVDNQIKQVFVNMLKNAIEAMPTGGSVHIHLRKQENCVIASFIDHGCGIPDERLATLGEPFYTTKDKGTGLGLMICYKIVENHHGKILIDSKVGEGTTFSIILPINKNKPVSQ